MLEIEKIREMMEVAISRSEMRVCSRDCGWTVDSENKFIPSDYKTGCCPMTIMVLGEYGLDAKGEVACSHEIFADRMGLAYSWVVDFIRGLDGLTDSYFIHEDSFELGIYFRRKYIDPPTVQNIREPELNLPDTTRTKRKNALSMEGMDGMASFSVSGGYTFPISKVEPEE